jgi:hypothetical protein
VIGFPEPETVLEAGKRTRNLPDQIFEFQRRGGDGQGDAACDGARYRAGMRHPLTGRPLLMMVFA